MTPDADDVFAEGTGELSTGAAGADEVAVIPWPLIWRERLAHTAESSERYPWIILAAGLFGLFSVGFTITVLSVSIPSIATELGTTTSVLTWVITGPILAFAIFGPAAGKLGDLLGSRRVYLASLLGVALFAGATALAWNAASLIAFRVLGAAIGAATGPSSLAMINKHFPPARRAQALGYWALVAAGGPVIGVVIGGPIVQAFGWRWIFVGQVPLTLVAFVIGFALLPETDRRTEVRFDVAGSVLLALGVGSFLVALNRGPASGWSSPMVVGCFVCFPLFIALFVVVERRLTHPLLPLEYFSRRNFTFPIANQFFANFAYMGGFVITPLLLESVLGYDAAHTGFLSIARPLAFAIAGPISGYVAVRVGERTNAVVGSLVIVASMLLLATVGPGTGDWVIIIALALSGVGMGTAAPAMAASIANAVREHDLGVVSAAQQMVAQVGIVAGIQILQTVQASREAEAGVAGSYHAAYLIGAFAAMLGVGAAVFVRSTRRIPPAELARDEGAPEGALSEPLERVSITR